jgi:hypothetical protein
MRSGSPRLLRATARARSRHHRADRQGRELSPGCKEKRVEPKIGSPGAGFQVDVAVPHLDVVVPTLVHRERRQATPMHRQEEESVHRQLQKPARGASTPPTPTTPNSRNPDLSSVRRGRERSREKRERNRGRETEAQAQAVGRG